MMRSLYSAVSGLKIHQTRMDVIANNIANVNTVGFKGSRVIFQDLYSPTLRPAAAPVQDGLGGTNPIQIGVGAAMATVDVSHTRTSATITGQPLDVAIEGDGFFVQRGLPDQESELFYTRAGNFYLDDNNYLVSGMGYYVLGWTGDNRPEATDDRGSLEAIEIDPNYYNIEINNMGEIIGIDKETTEIVVIGYVALANFNNQVALQKVGNNLYRQSRNSGEPQFSPFGEEGMAVLSTGALEMSNVDIAREFSDMIVTQRGFQANSRIITVSDQMLEELVNLKR